MSTDTKAAVRAVALIDLDGTLADFDGAMLSWMRKISHPSEEDIASKLMNQADEPEYIKERRRLIKNIPGFWRNLPKLERGFEVLHAVEKLDYDPIVLTNGPKKHQTAWQEKKDWCDLNVPHLPVIIGRDKGLVYGKVLVDDWPEYILRWLEWRVRGLVIMPAQPWNARFEHPNVLRYTGKNYDEMVARLAEQRKTATRE